MERVDFSLKRHWIWTQIRRQNSAFTVPKLYADCNRPNALTTVGRVGLWGYVNALQKHGYLEAGNREWERVTENESGIQAPILYGDQCYDPNKAGPVLIPRQRIWNALRAEGSLMHLSEIERRSGCSQTIVCRYLRQLEKAGIARGEKISGLKYYEFSDRPGPYHFPPVGKGLFDQVNNKIIEL
jgi:hypothetical protein